MKFIEKFINLYIKLASLKFTVKVFKVNKKVNNKVKGNKTIESTHHIAMLYSHYCVCDCEFAQNGNFCFRSVN